MKIGKMKILGVALLVSMFLCAQGNCTLKKYEYIRVVWAADFSEDSKTIYFVEKVIIGKGCLIGLFGPAPYFDVFNKTYLCKMNRDGDGMKRIAEIPCDPNFDFYRYRFWKGKKFLVDKSFKKIEGRLSEVTYYVYDIEKSSANEIVVYDSTTTAELIYRNCLWAKDGEGFYIKKHGNNYSAPDDPYSQTKVIKVNLVGKESVPTTIDNWKNAWNWSSAIDVGAYRDPDKDSEACILAHKLRKRKIRHFPFFKPFWWRK